MVRKRSWPAVSHYSMLVSEWVAQGPKGAKVALRFVASPSFRRARWCGFSANMFRKVYLTKEAAWRSYEVNSNGGDV